MQHAALLLAGGSGTRMGGLTGDKLLYEVGGRSVFAHSLRAFVESGIFRLLVIVYRDHRQKALLQAELAKVPDTVPVSFVVGGERRQDSVRAGLAAVPPSCERIWIHDCARPALRIETLQAIARTTSQHDGAFGLAHRVTDTIRSFPSAPVTQPARGNLLDRERLWAMETPQVFPRELLQRAHKALGEAVTDDLAAAEMLGEPVLLMENPFPNPKLTSPADLPLLSSLLQTETMNDFISFPAFRTGIGYDVHRLEAGRRLVLGGVEIPSEYGLVGHSDADVLSHAIADAILGAASLADIGHYFPDTDPAIEGISSLRILAKALAEVQAIGWAVVNIDATLIAERPRIAPWLASIRESLAETLEIEPEAVGIKATTNEGLGWIGRGEGMAAQAVASLTSAVKD